MSRYALRNFALLDTDLGRLQSGCEVLVEDELVTRVERGRIDVRDAEVIDLGGRTLMPGLIDCHVHIHPSILPTHPTMLPSLLSAHAGASLQKMLMRGFTTVRDAGGADAGHRKAVECGLFTGPRLFVAGRAISQTGGHGDSRAMSDQMPLCACTHLMGGIGRIADGVPEVRRAVRDEIRQGADQIKVMAGGGVATEADPIDHLQYSMEELEAIVDEAKRANRYVMAHVYTAEGIRRCIEAGIRTIEHGSLLDEPTAKLMAEAGAYLSPNLLVYRLIAERGEEFGYNSTHIAKGKEILAQGTRGLELARRYGVKTAFSSDLPQKTSVYQGDEFLVRAQAVPAAEILRSATIVNAEIVRMSGRLGVIAPGAYADMLAVDGNPLEDIGLLSNQGEHLSMIMRGGVPYKLRLSQTA
ncbi:MAG: amidohydrolase family protein [Burkholderiaceae bacterium]